MMKRADVAVYDLVRQLVEGRLEGGQTLRYGLKVGGVGLSEMKFTRHVIPAEFLETVEALKEKIIKGEIDVTDITR